MNGKTHMIVGVSTVAALCVTHPTLNLFGTEIHTWWGLLLSSTGALLPDIDIEGSKMGSKHKFLSKHLKHRGITHTLLVPAIVSVIIYFALGAIPVLPDVLFGFLIAYLSHIVADMFNKKGVPILWPITKHHFYVATFNAQKQSHNTIFIILWEACLLLWCIAKYTSLFGITI